MDIPEDIHLMIRRKFPDPEENAEVGKFIFSLWQRPINVWPDQLARAVLYLSNGNLQTIKEIDRSGFYGDPRDLILRANASTCTSSGDYFLTPFTDDRP